MLQCRLSESVASEGVGTGPVAFHASPAIGETGSSKRMSTSMKELNNRMEYSGIQSREVVMSNLLNKLNQLKMKRKEKDSEDGGTTMKTVIDEDKKLVPPRLIRRLKSQTDTENQNEIQDRCGTGQSRNTSVSSENDLNVLKSTSFGGSQKSSPGCSPGSASDDTDASGKESGYVTLEDLEEQLMMRMPWREADFRNKLCKNIKMINGGKSAVVEVTFRVKLDGQHCRENVKKNVASDDEFVQSDMSVDDDDDEDDDDDVFDAECPPEKTACSPIQIPGKSLCKSQTVDSLCKRGEVLKPRLKSTNCLDDRKSVLVPQEKRKDIVEPGGESSVTSSTQGSSRKEGRSKENQDHQKVGQGKQVTHVENETFRKTRCEFDKSRNVVTENPKLHCGTVPVGVTGRKIFEEEAIHMSWDEVAQEARSLGINLILPASSQNQTVKRKEKVSFLIPTSDSCSSIKKTHGNGSSGEVIRKSRGNSGSDRSCSKYDYCDNEDGSSIPKNKNSDKSRRSFSGILKMRNIFGVGSKRSLRDHSADGLKRSPTKVAAARNEVTTSGILKCRARSSTRYSDESRNNFSISAEVGRNGNMADVEKSKTLNVCRSRRVHARSSTRRCASGNSSGDELEENSVQVRRHRTNHHHHHHHHHLDRDEGRAISYVSTTLPAKLEGGIFDESGQRLKKCDLIRSLDQLQNCGWYWGSLSVDDAETCLAHRPDGAFLVRDSSDDRHIFSLSFRSMSRTHHTRIEHYKGLFCLATQPLSPGATTITGLIEQSAKFSSGGMCYLLRSGSRSRSVPVQLLYPMSRFRTMHPLKNLCKFAVMRYVRADMIDRLPISPRLKEFLRAGGSGAGGVVGIGGGGGGDATILVK